jgi:uncharacterized protein (TIGR00730 family)
MAATNPSPTSPRVSAATKRAKRLVNEIVDIASGLLDDETSIGDLKIFAASLREMREACRVFALHRTARKVTTFGSARTPPGDPAYVTAEEFSRRIAEAGYMLLTGAGGGIMEACQRGAGRDRSFGVNIQLPFEQQANEFIDGDSKLTSFKYFFTRKLFFIKETDAVVLLPGGFGTLDEGFEILTLLQTGKCQPMPVVMLDAPRGTYWKTWQRYVEDHLLRRRLISEEDLALYKITDDVDEAVDEIRSFHRVFHSARYVRDLLVLRLHRRLGRPSIAELERAFADILKPGTGIVQRGAFPVESDEPEIWDLTRLALRFNHTGFGRLRRLIDEINAA